MLIKKRIRIFLLFVLVFVLCIIIRLFVCEIFYVPSSSMENTLLKGDLIFVNKLYYGGRIPQTIYDIPWINSIAYFTKDYIEIQREQEQSFKSQRLYAFSKISRNDVVVLNQPNNKNSYFVKRCVGLPNDTLKIANYNLIVNNKIISDLKLVKNKYNILYNNQQHFSQIARELQIHYNEDWYQRKNSSKEISLTQEQKRKIELIVGKENISIIPLNEYKTEIIPYKNQQINNRLLLKIANKYEKNIKKRRLNSPQKINQNYYFFLGDNRGESYDSRDFGVIPESHIIGKATFILFSISENGILRFDRFLKKIH